MTADVISHPKVILDGLADRIRVAFVRTEQGRAEWIEGTLELAAALAEARARFPSDLAFSHWLVDNELEHIGKNDRGALINIAIHTEISRRLLQETQRFSWRLIWEEEIKGQVPNAGKPESTSCFSPEAPETQPVAAGSEERVSDPAPKSASTSSTKPKSVDPRHSFFGLPRADEVAAIYLESRARVTIKQACSKKGGAVWALILKALDAGFLAPTHTNFNSATMRILFPNGDTTYCGRFDLTDRNERKKVEDYIMPAALANRETVIAAPETLEGIVVAHWQREQAAVIKRKTDDAVRDLPSEQQEIVMFGQRLWPRTEHQFGTYEYKQLCAAIWYFKGQNEWLACSKVGETPGSRAILMRLSIRWLSEYADVDCVADETRGKVKKVYQLIQMLAGLLERNPNGECVAPSSPKIEGQW
jgi:hypothetical protein